MRMEKEENPRRLCSEIQLFDLCEKTSCPRKDGRFCTDSGILAKFEAISDDEGAGEQDQYLADEMDEMEEDELSYDRGVGVDDEYEEEEPEEEES
jgi:hypothetical protein